MAAMTPVGTTYICGTCNAGTHTSTQKSSLVGKPYNYYINREIIYLSYTLVIVFQVDLSIVVSIYSYKQYMNDYD